MGPGAGCRGVEAAIGVGAGFKVQGSRFKVVAAAMREWGEACVEDGEGEFKV